MTQSLSVTITASGGVGEAEFGEWVKQSLSVKDTASGGVLALKALNFLNFRQFITLFSDNLREILEELPNASSHCIPMVIAPTKGGELHHATSPEMFVSLIRKLVQNKGFHST